MELWQWHCRNRIKKKKKNLPIDLWQCHCRNKGVKIFFLGNCGNPIAENGKEKKKWFPKSVKELKKSTTSKIFLQHFHNKLQVIRIISSNLNLTMKGIEGLGYIM